MEVVLAAWVLIRWVVLRVVLRVVLQVVLALCVLPQHWAKGGCKRRLEALCGVVALLGMSRWLRNLNLRQSGKVAQATELWIST